MQDHSLKKDQFIDSISHLYDMTEVDAIWRYIRDSSYVKERKLAGRSLKNIIEDLLPALISGLPVQYALNESWFYNLPLYVDPSVLIPRPETEELVQLILNHIKQESISPSDLRILDIGTGSGCIALALKSQLVEAEVWAMDISTEALEVARKNSRALKLDIRFMQGDILEWEVVFDPLMKWDIVVSNPPYITPKEKLEMHPNVLEHEPDTALFVPEESPLLFYDHVASFGLQHLTAGGHLFVEINKNYGAQVADLFRKKGYQDVVIHEDMQGFERMVAANLKQLINQK